MPEHRIRFRGGWESSPVGGDPGNARKLTLPVAWPDGPGGTVRLTRRFGRPPDLAEGETIWLELRDVPGLRSLQLNGVDLGPPPSDGVGWTLPLAGRLADRNTLTLEVALDGETPGGWGSIALVIVSESGSGD